MAIQLRRGNEADLDISQLRPGELAVCLDSGKVIVKLSGDNYLTLSDMPTLRAMVDGKAASYHMHAVATQSEAGFMSPADKIALDSLMESGGTEEESDGLVETTLWTSSVGYTEVAAGGTLTISENIRDYKFVEIYYFNGIGMECAKGIIITTSGTVGTSLPISLIRYSYDSTAQALLLYSGTALIRTSGQQSTLTVSDNAFSFYRVIGYQ